jgi:hypothetical protein
MSASFVYGFLVGQLATVTLLAVSIWLFCFKVPEKRKLVIADSALAPEKVNSLSGLHLPVTITERALCRSFTVRLALASNHHRESLVPIVESNLSYVVDSLFSCDKMQPQRRWSEISGASGFLEETCDWLNILAARLYAELLSSGFKPYLLQLLVDELHQNKLPNFLVWALSYRRPRKLYWNGPI